MPQKHNADCMNHEQLEKNLWAATDKTASDLKPSEHSTPVLG